MRNFRIALLFIAAFSFVSAVSAQQSKQLDTFGYYYIEKPIKAFADISEISLGGDYGLTEKPVYYGLIRLKKRSSDFRLLKPTLNGTAIAFSTKAVNGVSYKFSGNFTRLFVKHQDSPDELNNGGIVLQGTLIKLKKGVEIARQVVKFTYFTGT